MSSENEKNQVSRDCNGSELQTGDLVWHASKRNGYSHGFPGEPFIVGSAKFKYPYRELFTQSGDNVCPGGIFDLTKFRGDPFLTAARKVLRDAKGL